MRPRPTWSAVSYHFGSLKSLCDAAIEHALERYLNAQQEAVSALVSESTLENGPQRSLDR